MHIISEALEHINILSQQCCTFEIFYTIKTYYFQEFMLSKVTSNNKLHGICFNTKIMKLINYQHDVILVIIRFYMKPIDIHLLYEYMSQNAMSVNQAVKYTHTQNALSHDSK